MKLNNAEVIYVYPYYWGFFIDISHLQSRGYRETQELLVKKLNKTTGSDSWFVEDDQVDDRLWHMKENQVYGGSTKLGTSFLARRITPTEVIEGENYRAHVEEIRFYYHEFGTATSRVLIRYETIKEPISYQEFEDSTRSNELVGQISEFINTFIRIDCQVLTNKLQENNIPLAIDSQYFRELINSDSVKVSNQKALWEHVIYVVDIDQDGSLTEEDIFPYKPLINSSQQDGPMEASLADNIHLYPGFGTSLIVTNKNADHHQTNLVRTLEIAEYFYAATGLLDDFLYDKFISFALHNITTPKIPVIKRDMEEIKTLSNLLEVFLFILKDSLINLNAHAKIIWNVYEQEWYYNPMLESLEEKSHILNEKYRDLLNELNEKRNQTLNRLVKIFTVFAIIGPSIELFQFVEEKDLFGKLLALPPVVLLGGGALILLVLIGIGGYFFQKFRQFY